MHPIQKRSIFYDNAERYTIILPVLFTTKRLLYSTRSTFPLSFIIYVCICGSNRTLNIVIKSDFCQTQYLSTIVIILKFKNNFHILCTLYVKT